MELSELIHSSSEADKIYQPLLEYIRKKRRGELTPPYVPKCPILPPHKLAVLSVLWKEAGFEQESSELKEWVSSLAPFPTLWCLDREYQEAKEVSVFPGSDRKNSLVNSFGLDLTFLDGGSVFSALTLDGNGTSLGVIRSKEVEIRAFGPQSASLQFGIQGRGCQGWTQTMAYPEIWLEMKSGRFPDQLRLDLRFVGITLETPLFFAFYIKANSCQIGLEILKPKSLRRYQGETAALSFQNQFTISTEQPCKVEVIPLAGEGCFWDTDFLVLFPLHPFLSQISFGFNS